MKTNRLYRSRQQVVGGVCGGIANYLNLDVSIVRLITLVTILFGGVSFWFYVLAWVIIPVEPREYSVNYTTKTNYTGPQNDDVVIIEDEKPAQRSKVKQNQPEDNGPEW